MSEVYTHLQNMLFVDCDRRWYGAFADVVCPVDMFSPVLVHQNSKSVFALGFSTAHDYVSLLYLLNICIACSPRFTDQKKHPTGCILPLLGSILQIVPLSSANSHCFVFFTCFCHLLSCLLQCCSCCLRLCFHFLHVLSSFCCHHHILLC